MAKTTAPLLSFTASGQIAKAQVYSKWKGRPYVRRHVIPSNPQSVAQTSTRDIFAWLSNTWKIAPPLLQAPWTLFAQGQVLTNRNAYTGRNIAAMRNAGGIADVDLNNFIMSPGAKGGLPPVSAVATPGSLSLSVAVVEPTSIPTGWTITAGIAAAIRDQDPATGLLFTVTAIEDLVSPYVCVLSGLTASVIYQVGGWLQWAKPDGSVAYSTAVRSQATPSP